VDCKYKTSIQKRQKKAVQTARPYQNTIRKINC
jgi:hypothetical protein